MPDGLINCEICQRVFPLESRYVVKIEIYADPTMPDTTAQALATTNFEQQMKALMKQMENMSSDELQDAVHRQFEFSICPDCQAKMIANPLGLPRDRRTTGN